MFSQPGDIQFCLSKLSLQISWIVVDSHVGQRRLAGRHGSWPEGWNPWACFALHDKAAQSRDPTWLEYILARGAAPMDEHKFAYPANVGLIAAYLHLKHSKPRAFRCPSLDDTI